MEQRSNEATTVSGEGSNKTHRRNAGKRRSALAERIAVGEFDTTGPTYAGNDHTTPSPSASELWNGGAKAAAVFTVAVGVGAFVMNNASTLATLASVARSIKSLIVSGESSVAPARQKPAPLGKQKEPRSWLKWAGVVGLAGCVAATVAFPKVSIPILAKVPAMSAEEKAAWIEDGEQYNPLWDVEHRGMQWAQVSSTKVLVGALTLGAAGYGAASVCSTVLRQNTSPIGAERSTAFISDTLTRPALSSSQLRQVFVDIPLVRSPITKNHTHGASARDRNTGTATAALVARAMGFEPYFIQRSLADMRKGYRGCRSYHWAKDVGVDPQEFGFDSMKEAPVLVDVDEYLDMPDLLARFPGTYFISTFQPEAAAAYKGEFCFRFDEDGVHYEVAGGAEYKHQVWDYSGDTLIVENVGVFGKRVIVYHIDRKKTGDHHCLIMLSVIGAFDSYSVVPTDWLIQGRRLERLDPVRGDYVVIDVMRPAGLFRSVALLGDYTAVTLPRNKFDAIRAVARVGKTEISPATVATNIAEATPLGVPVERMPEGHPAILAGFIRQGEIRAPPVVYPPSECLIPIYFGQHSHDTVVPLEAFGSPLIGPCYGFARDLAADNRCVEGRIEAFHGRKEFEDPISAEYATLFHEFAQFVVPECEVGTGVPYDDDYTREKQNRPPQRSILDEADVTGPAYDVSWDAFLKVETYQKPTDPRNISQSKPPVKRMYAPYMYAFHDGVMAKQAWYAFAKTPAECAERVAEVLREAAFAVLADGSRFDGHVSRRARILERLVLFRWYGKQYHAALNEAMDKQFGIKGRTAEGRRYKTEYDRGSGSQETSDLNSLLTCFIDYAAWRKTEVNGVKCTPEMAWAHLGIYGGDDSLAGAVDPIALENAAKFMGQDYEITVVPRGQAGVEFLNRQFGPDVFEGDVHSCANPARLLSKLYVGPRGLPDPLERFAERAAGYYRSDRESPVIGPIVKLAHKLLGDRTSGVLMSWDGRHSLETNWPNEDSGWMEDWFNQRVPDFDWGRYVDWIIDIETSGDASLFLKAPLCTPAPVSPPKVKVDCVVGEDLCRAPPKDKEEAYPEDVKQADELVPRLLSQKPDPGRDNDQELVASGNVEGLANLKGELRATWIDKFYKRKTLKHCHRCGGDWFCKDHPIKCRKCKSNMPCPCPARK